MFLGQEDDEDDEENDENGKNLDHQPTIGRHRLKVFDDLSVSGFDVQLRVFYVRVDPLYGLFLLFNHMSQLLKDCSEFNNRLFYVDHRI